MDKRYLAGMLALLLAACARATSEQPPAVAAAMDSSMRAGATWRLDEGSILTLTLKDSIASTTNRPGEVVPAVIADEVRDVDGNLIFPAGSEAQVRIVAFQPPMPNQDDGRALLQLAGAEVAGQDYQLLPLPDADANAADSTGGPSVRSVGIMASVRADVIGGLVSTESGQRDLVVRPTTRLQFRLTQPVVVTTSRG